MKVKLTIGYLTLSDLKLAFRGIKESELLSYEENRDPDTGSVEDGDGGVDSITVKVLKETSNSVFKALAMLDAVLEVANALNSHAKSEYGETCEIHLVEVEN